MKTRSFIVSMFLLALTLTPAWMFGMPAPPPPFSITLISPTAGQVLYAGQRVRVEWKTSNSTPINTLCELELWLSLDGGRTYTVRITPSMDPNTTFVYWIVPNTPTNSAVLDIRFGCEPFYPETYNAQTASPFVIASGSGQ